MNIEALFTCTPTFYDMILLQTLVCQRLDLLLQIFTIGLCFILPSDRFAQ